MMMHHSIYPTLTNSPPSKTKKLTSNPCQPVKFPEDIQIIIRSDRTDYGNLYIGNLQSAQNVQLLENLKIGAVLSVAKGYKVTHPNNIVRHYRYIPLPDKETVEFYGELLESVEFIQNSMLLTNVLVHCVSGGSRSGCIAMAFLIKSRKLSSQDAESEVINRRKMILITETMNLQLKKYELDLNNTGFRKSRFNYSMRADSRKSKSQMDKSYFNSQVCQSQRSLKSGDKNISMLNIPDKSVRSKSKSSVREEPLRISQQTFKSKTMAENPEYHEEEKDWKSVSFELANSPFNMEKVLERTEKVYNSRGPLHKRKSRTVMVQPFASEPSEIEVMSELTMSKKQSISREQFDKKVKKIEQRNDFLNQRIGQIENRFTKTAEVNKQLLQCQLKEIDSLRLSMTSKHLEEASPIKGTKRTAIKENSSNRASSIRSGLSSRRQNTISAISEF